MIIFFETYSLIQSLLLINKIRRARTIYFHKLSFPFPYRGGSKLWVEKILRIFIHMFNRNVVIETISYETTASYSWLSNKESIDFIIQMTHRIEHSPLYRIMLSIVKDKNLIKHYQYGLAHGYVSNKIVFRKVALDFIKTEPETIVVPAENDWLDIEKSPLNLSIIKQTPFRIRIFNSIIYSLYRIGYLFVFSVAPFLFLLQKIFINGITLKPVNPLLCNVRASVIWGLNEDKKRFGVLSEANDGFLYSDAIGLTDIVYVFYSKKKYFPGTKEKSKTFMNQRDINYFEDNEFKVNYRLLVLILKTQIKLIIMTPWLLGGIKENYQLLILHLLAMKRFFDKTLELQHIDYKLEFSRADASLSHIMDHIVLNLQSKKSIMTHHTASPYDMPYLAFVHADKYLVYGNLYCKLFSPYWEGLNIEKVGRINIDWTVNLVKPDNQAILVEKYHQLYPDRTFTILVIFPGNNFSKTSSRQWTEIFEGVKAFTLTDIDANLFLRFRPSNFGDKTKTVQQFIELTKQDGRLIIDHKNFTTQELMVFSDLVIACNASFGINEALATKAKVFTFAYMLHEKYWFKGYGKDFILYNRNDFLKAVKGLENNFKGFDCHWNALKKDLSYNYDGKNLERTQWVVLNTIKKVQKERGVSINNA